MSLFDIDTETKICAINHNILLLSNEINDIKSRLLDMSLVNIALMETISYDDKEKLKEKLDYFIHRLEELREKYQDEFDKIKEENDKLKESMEEIKENLNHTKNINFDTFDLFMQTEDLAKKEGEDNGDK